MFLVESVKKSFKLNQLCKLNFVDVRFVFGIQQKSILLLLLFVLSGCASLDLSLPISEIESPRHQGRKTGWGVDFSGGTSKKLSLVSDPSARPLDLDNTKHTTANLFLTKNGLNYYFWDRVSLSGILIDSKTPAIRLKVSLLNGYKEDSQIGEWYAALYTEGAYQQAEVSGNQNGAGGATGFPWNGKSTLASGAAGLSIGFQIFKKALPFVGVNYQQFQTSGQIVQSPSSSDSGGTYKVSLENGTVLTYGIGLDYRPNSRFYIVPQVYYYNLKWYENSYSEVGGSIKLLYVPVQ